MRKIFTISAGSTQPSKSDPTLEYRTFWCHYTIGNIGEKTIILKSFSPIPVALLILNNLPQDLIFSPDIKSFVLQNQLNIGLLVILGIYTYHLFSTFSAQNKSLPIYPRSKKNSTFWVHRTLNFLFPTVEIIQNPHNPR